MSVLIKGMQMPKCCRECDAEGHYDNSYGDEYGFFCPFGYKAYTSETRELKRLDNCPLVPVPPHGRLIDADALKEKFPNPDNWLDQKDVSCHVTGVWARIDNAPTVITAEEGA